MLDRNTSKSNTDEGETDRSPDEGQTHRGPHKGQAHREAHEEGQKHPNCHRDAETKLRWKMGLRRRRLGMPQDVKTTDRDGDEETHRDADTRRNTNSLPGSDIQKRYRDRDSA